MVHDCYYPFILNFDSNVNKYLLYIINKYLLLLRYSGVCLSENIDLVLLTLLLAANTTAMAPRLCSIFWVRVT